MPPSPLKAPLPQLPPAVFQAHPQLHLPLASFFPTQHTLQQSPPSLPPREWLCRSQGPGLRSPAWHVPRLRAGLSPETSATTSVPWAQSCCQGYRRLPPTDSPWVRVCKRQGSDCRVTVFWTPDSTRGSLALLSLISGTLGRSQAPSKNTLLFTLH